MPIKELYYPINFREEISKELGAHIKNRHSVLIVGIRRVGISNFLRFFLNNKDVIDTFVEKDKNHLFISVDLNDLVEREIYPFWVLTLKRIVDSIEGLDLDESTKNWFQEIFLNSIQPNDLFLVIEGVRKSLVKISKLGFIPTVFLIRFDRIRDKVTPELFSNIEGIKEATQHQVSFIFTTYRSFESLAPEFLNKNLIVTNTMYLPLAKDEDLEIVMDGFIKKYNLHIPEKVRGWLKKLSGGYMQYLQLSLIILNEQKRDFQNEEELLVFLINNERIKLQSEEILESLTESEQNYLSKIIKGEETNIKDVEYLEHTGVVKEKEIFSPLFEDFLLKKDHQTVGNLELSKKELLLFGYLKSNLNEVCERENLIEQVWPEEEELGVSDWAIDRLVSRLRNKLKMQKNPYEIVTIKTRGFKLTSQSD